MSKMKTPEELAEEYVVSKPFHCANDAYVAGYHAALNSEVIQGMLEELKCAHDDIRRVNNNIKGAINWFNATIKTEGES